jgi:hypothetical protein
MSDVKEVRRDACYSDLVAVVEPDGARPDGREERGAPVVEP